MFTEGELGELALVDLDDDFVEANVRSRKFDVELGRRVVQGVCDGFVQTFLADDDVATLHRQLYECDASLADIERILRQFIVNLETIQKDIGDVRERLKRVGVQLVNARAAERVVWGAMSRCVVPPEVVRVIVQCSDEELGPQFMLSAQQLLQFLQDRREGSCRIGAGVPPVSLTSCRLYTEQLEMLDRLTVHACVKMKRFLTKKVALLSVKNTNVSIQQEHVLKPYAFYVRFLRSAAPLLRHSHLANEPNAESPAYLPLRIAKALYDELCRAYCDTMSRLYLARIRQYVMTLNSMESSTQTVHLVPTQAYVLPLLTDAQEATPLSTFALGDRGDILEDVTALPLVPAVERARRRRHFYEETFRSMNVLLCDAVTHEFLFTFMFFSGDMSVFVDVFKPTIQFVVDYVAEVMLDQGDGSVRRMLRDEYPQAAVNANCRFDCYGLLLLIRLCHDFRSLMKDVRRLSCLEGFYDSLLLLLWPAFQRTFERQMLAIRSADVAVLARVLMNDDGHRTAAWVAHVHPLAKRYAAFTTALMTISRGCGFDATDAVGEASLLATMTEGGGGSRGHSNDYSFAELRRLAWCAVEAERASDAADSASRFAVLAGNLSFMRVEVVRVLQEMGRHLATGDAKRPELHELYVLAFLLNNLHYILSAWRVAFDASKSDDTVESNGDDYSTLSEDYRALDELKKSRRGDLVGRLVLRYFAAVYNVVQCDEMPERSPAEVLATADAFTQSWKSGLDDVCSTVRAMLFEPAHVSEVLAQVCMDVLLCNTRFHACVSRALDNMGAEETRRTLRSYVVTNQQMLQYMRTLATMPEDEEEEEEEDEGGADL
ncbi:Vacuolar protein sorting protein [Trypanosoma grayi]|uniref:Vacuolar protein sorting protein n=1 Tax=Trypanosoma grayi TaxID=71804 RepID=UPI0004F49B69|nr:Vacuolar protein sorting protein [Trypanosoma grayi]KEG12272.1 Vacuolar protein sorting protein [Trypanosoma grayi]